MSRFVNFLELSLSFDLPPAEAVAYFQKKGLASSFAWQDIIGDEHDVAFTVAKMMDTDLLKAVKDKLDSAIANGSTLQDFKKTLIPQLQAAGWWGKADVVDPLTGQVVKAQLGSASRLETIFRTNVQGAYAAGHWHQIKANQDTAPFLLYDAVDDYRTRPEHAHWDGTVLSVTDDFWREWYPPNGWNCRCGVIQLSAEEIDDLGLSVSKSPKVKRHQWTNPRTNEKRSVPDGLDPGWDHNPGIARKKRIKAVAAEKGVKVPPVVKAPPVVKVKPAVPALPKFKPQKTVSAASRLATEIVRTPGTTPWPRAPGETPFVRFRHVGTRGTADVIKRRIGQGDLSGLDVPTANHVLQWLHDNAAAASDALGLPRLQGVTTSAGSRAGASMGDGVLAVSKRKRTVTAFSTVQEQRTSRAAEYNKWKAADGNDGARPYTVGDYFADPKDALTSTLWHEFAHHLHQLFKVTNATQYGSPPLEERLHALIFGQAGAPRRVNDLALPSKYARTNAKECFAECFALYKMGRSELVPQFMLDIIAAVERGEMP